MPWVEAAREHKGLIVQFTCAPSYTRGTTSSLYAKVQPEPWAVTVQSQLRNARVPRKDGPFRIRLNEHGDLIENIYVWRHEILKDEKTAFFRFEFLATHVDCRRQGLANAAYDEFLQSTYDVIDDNVELEIAQYEADVHRDNKAMRLFLRERGWSSDGIFIDGDYMVFMKRLQLLGPE